MLRKNFTFLFFTISLTVSAFSQSPINWKYELITLKSGDKLNYVAALPADFDSSKTYPLLLALPPGGQGADMVVYGLRDYWSQEARKRKWVVISPIVPPGGYAGGSNMEELYNHISKKYNLKGQKIHLAGISNGGRSSFKVALKHPQYFKSITVLAGYTPNYDELTKIKHIPINLYVGERDLRWVKPMAEMKDQLKKLGAQVNWVVVPNEEHVIQSLINNPLLFDVMIDPTN